VMLFDGATLTTGTTNSNNFFIGSLTWSGTATIAVPSGTTFRMGGGTLAGDEGSTLVKTGPGGLVLGSARTIGALPDVNLSIGISSTGQVSGLVVQEGTVNFQCYLLLTVDNDATINPGDTFTLVSNTSGNALQGSLFDPDTGLPLQEGAQVMVNGHLFQITYHGGQSGQDVVLTAIF